MVCACPSEAKHGRSGLLRIGVYVLYLNVWYGGCTSKHERIV